MRKEKAFEALDRISNYCEEIDWHIPEEERTGYKMSPDIQVVKDYIFNSNPINKCGTCQHYTGIAEEWPKYYRYHSVDKSGKKGW